MRFQSRLPPTGPLEIGPSGCLQKRTQRSRRAQTRRQPLETLDITPESELETEPLSRAGPAGTETASALRFKSRLPPESEPAAACVGAAESRGGRSPPASRAGASAAIPRRRRSARRSRARIPAACVGAGASRAGGAAATKPSEHRARRSRREPARRMLGAAGEATRGERVGSLPAGRRTRPGRGWDFYYSAQRGRRALPSASARCGRPAGSLPSHGPARPHSRSRPGRKGGRGPHQLRRRRPTGVGVCVEPPSRAILRRRRPHRAGCR